jgi:hypothetical protein
MLRTKNVAACALKLITAYALLLTPSSASPAQDAPAFDKSKVPAEGREIAEFVPAGWVLEEQVAGDLNGDAVPDLALKLIQQKRSDAGEDEIVERQRALVVLFRSADGGLRRAGVADRVLQCTSCGGAFYGVVEAPSEVTIERGVIVVRQESGSREVTEHTFRFRYDPASARFVLIGFDSVTRDRADASVTEESTNFLTGRKIIKTSTPPRTGRGRDIVRTRTQTVPRKLTPMEEVSSENFYN